MTGGNHARPTDANTPGYVEPIFRYYQLTIISDAGGGGGSPYYTNIIWRGYCNTLKGVYQRTAGVMVSTVTVS